MKDESSDAVLKNAVEMQNAGKLQEARAVYQWVLEGEPNHPVALHLTGLLARQVGRPDIAEPLIRRALAVRPDYAEAHADLGLLLHETGRNDEAHLEMKQAFALLPRLMEHPTLKTLFSDLMEADS